LVDGDMVGSPAGSPTERHPAPRHGKDDTAARRFGQHVLEATVEKAEIRRRTLDDAPRRSSRLRQRRQEELERSVPAQPLAAAEETTGPGAALDGGGDGGPRIGRPERDRLSQ